MQCADQLTPDIVEGVVVEAEDSLDPAIGDAALGDRASRSSGRASGNTASTAEATG
jgi:hypothetical protein